MSQDMSVNMIHTCFARVHPHLELQGPLEANKVDVHVSC